MTPTLYIVHCVDTEGPLHESLEATFDRLRLIFGLDLEPSPETLKGLQAGSMDLGGIEDAVKKVVDPHLLAYNDTWDKIDRMLDECMSESFRMRLPDSTGSGWVYNWFCVDHVDYHLNPRRRDIGYHNVFDHYRRRLSAHSPTRDGLHFHYHPHGPRGEAHRCATRWWGASDSLYQVMCRRIIDRGWFPSANRPGFHVTRPDSHWFLEQHVPFDFANQATVGDRSDEAQRDAAGGRFGDWRRAPLSWRPYHPCHDDYQVPGECRRWIARCLNVGTRYAILGLEDVRQAFSEARHEGSAVLAFTNHDFRDIRSDIDGVRAMLQVVAPEFPDVAFEYSEAVAAMQRALRLPADLGCDLELCIESLGEGAHRLNVASSVPTFGPQPWLALKTTTGDYVHDNFDIDVPFRQWSYVFDDETCVLGALEAVGVAANSAHGVTTVRVMDTVTDESRTYQYGLRTGSEACRS